MLSRRQDLLQARGQVQTMFEVNLQLQGLLETT